MRDRHSALRPPTALLGDRNRQLPDWLDRTLPAIHVEAAPARS